MKGTSPPSRPSALHRSGRRLPDAARRSALGSVLIVCLAAPRAHAGMKPQPPLPRIAQSIHAQAPDISPQAILTTLKAYFRVRQMHLTDRPLVTIVDFTVPSGKPRLAVANVLTGKVLVYTYVAHGKGSGQTYATRFSNRPGTDESSLGVYLTGRTYYGKHGYSLRLHGLDPAFNGAAYLRNIVVHSAAYVGRAFAQERGRVGRSWGCFALSPAVEDSVVRLIREHTVLVGYYPDRAWLQGSAILNPPS